jgi:hypothetical protein
LRAVNSIENPLSGNNKTGNGGLLCVDKTSQRAAMRIEASYSSPVANLHSDFGGKVLSISQEGFCLP